MTSDSSVSAAPATEEHNPLIIVGLVLAIAAVGGWYWLRSDASDSALAASPPSLQLKAPACAQQGEPAERAATLQMSNARSQWERAVFEPRLAPVAARNARLAAQCFGAAGLNAQAHAADAVALGYAREANEDYARQRLRLKVALRRGSRESARRAIERLRALLENDDSEYLRGLGRIEREWSAEESGQ